MLDDRAANTVARTAGFAMKKRYETTPVKGGWVKREARSGDLVAVSTGKGVSRVSAATQAAVREASSRRSSALKRLADR